MGTGMLRIGELADEIGMHMRFALLEINPSYVDSFSEIKNPGE